MRIATKKNIVYDGLIYIATLMLASIAAIFSMKLMYGDFIYAKNNFAFFSGKTLDEKYAMVDGEFYKFMLFCKSNIPQGSSVLFYNSWNYCAVKYGGRAYVQFEYERHKSKFYLCPLKANILFYLDEILLNEGRLHYYNEEEQIKNASYIIVAHPDREFPGFKVKYRYDADHYILARAEKDDV